MRFKKTILSALALTTTLAAFGGLSATTLGSTNEVATLIEYKDSFLKGNAGVINVLAEIVSMDANSNKNQTLVANASDVVLNPDNNPIQEFNLLTKTEAQINANDPFFRANQNAPKNPTVFAPFQSPGDVKNIQAGVPLFFISYFQDGNSSQEGGYTIVKVVTNTGAIVNRMFLGQAKASDTYQIPAKNKTYTYGFYQTQNVNNLFLSGGNLNTTPTGITGLTLDSLPIANGYKVYVQNINKFGFKSDEIMAGTLNVIPSSVGGSIVKVGNDGDRRTYASYQTDPTKFWFSSPDSVNIVVNLGGAAKAEYVNNSVNDSNAGASDGSDWKFSNVKLLEGQNYVIINFKDSSDKIINTIPLVITVDTKAPVMFALSLNEVDYANKRTVDGEINIVKANSVWNVNDKLSPDGVENLNDQVPVYMEYLDNNLQNFKIYYGDSEGAVTTLVNNYSGSGYINGKRWVKFNISGDAGIDLPKKTWFKAVDGFGNTTPPRAIVYDLNRTVSKPFIITNNGNDFSIKADKIDLRISVDKDVNRVRINDREVGVGLGNTELTLHGVLLVEGENSFEVRAVDMMDNVSQPATIKIIRNPPSPEGLVGTDTQLKINGNVNADDINFNRVTNDGSAGEIIQGN